jgi:outer membrane protein assembly factor BamB
VPAARPRRQGGQPCAAKTKDPDGPSLPSGFTDNYATTPVAVNGVVYTQDLKSNVMAIRLATGKVLWTHTYNSQNGGPPGTRCRTCGGTRPSTPAGACGIRRRSFSASIAKATGEMVAVSQDTGKIEWADQLPSSPYGAAAVTNNVVFTTTYSGDLYAFNATTGAILLKKPLSALTNAAVTIDGDYVIVGAGLAITSAQRPLIIACKLRATGKLPDTVGS